MKSKSLKSEPHQFTDDYLPYLLARASLLVSQQFHRQLAEAGLRVPEWRVLAILSDREEASVGQLAEMTLLKQPTLTRVVTKMEELGWVRRYGEREDRRVTRVSITPLGQRVVSDLLRRAKAHEAQVLQGYSAGEVEAMKAGLRELIDRCRDD
jgi:DNA-binding MarR family transcriptional regulator